MISQDPLTVEIGSQFSSVSGNLMVSLLEQSQDCVKLIAPDGRLGFMNRNGRCTMEIDGFCTVAGSYWWDLWPDESRRRVQDAVNGATAGAESRFEAFCPTAKGTPKWWDVTVSPVRDDAGRIFQIVSFSRDITEQVKSREALETMAFEMQHRLRNAFSVSSAIALVSAKHAPEHTQFARDLADRYAALATAQSKMLEAGDHSPALTDLIEVLVAPYPQIEVICPAGLPISDRNAKVVALAVGELATNSMTYGALAQGRPVRIEASLRENQLSLDWIEEGVVRAASDQTGPGGKGHQLITRMANVFGGSFTADWHDRGLTAAVSLPA